MFPAGALETAREARALPVPRVHAARDGGGVAAYFAFLHGKRVLYLGRNGEQHVEWFPGAQP